MQVTGIIAQQLLDILDAARGGLLGEDHSWV